MSSEEIISTVLTRVIEDYSSDQKSRYESKIEDADTPPLKKMTQEDANINGMRNATSQKISWVLGFLSQLSGWLLLQSSTIQTAVQEAPNVAEEDEMWKDWEWVLSKTEEFSLKHTSEDAKKIQEELQTLRANAQTLQFRPYFRTCIATPTIQSLSQEDRADLNSVLDSSKTSKIITDVVNHFQDKWLNMALLTFFDNHPSRKQFEDSFKEKPYEKNIVGSMKELAFSASHGPKDVGINDKVLADILWSLWKPLTEAIKSSLGRRLDQNELLILANQVSEAKDQIVRLWIDTVRNSRLGSSLAGQVVNKWNQAKLEEKKRISKLIERGIDARWAPATYKPPEREPIEVEADIKKLKQVLEHKLHFLPVRS